MENVLGVSLSRSSQEELRRAYLDWRDLSDTYIGELHAAVASASCTSPDLRPLLRELEKARMRFDDVITPYVTCRSVATSS